MSPEKGLTPSCGMTTSQRKENKTAFKLVRFSKNVCINRLYIYTVADPDIPFKGHEMRLNARGLSGVMEVEN